MSKENTKNKTTATKGKQGLVAWGDNTDVSLGLHQPAGVVLGKDDAGNYIVDDRQTHVMISAATGGGKSAGPVICTLLNYKQSVLATDIKGELFHTTGGFRSTFSDVHVFDPLGSLELKTVTQINPLLDVMPGLEGVRQCEIIAKALIPIPQQSSPTEDDDIILTRYEHAREWLTGLLLYILHCEKIDNIHLGRVYDLLVLGPVGEGAEDNPGGFGELMQNCVIAPYKSKKADSAKHIEKMLYELSNVRTYVQSIGKAICTKDDESAAHIIRILIRNLDALRNPSVVNALKTQTFSLRDFLTAKNPQTLYLVAPPQDIPVLAPLLRVIVELTSRIIMEQEPVRADAMKKKSVKKLAPAPAQFSWPKLHKRHNVLFLLDESQKYNKLETLEKAASLIRSYGGRIVMITQSLSMLQKIYGKDSDLFSNCGIKLFLAVADLDEAETISRYVGKSAGFEIHKKSPATTEDATPVVNIQTQARDVITPDEVMRLSETEARETAVLLTQGIKPLKIERAYYYDDPDLAQATQTKFTGTIATEPRKSHWHKIRRAPAKKKS